MSEVYNPNFETEHSDSRGRRWKKINPEENPESTGVTAEEMIKKLRENKEKNDSKSGLAEEGEKEFDMEKFSKENSVDKKTKFDEYGEIIIDEDEK